MKNDEANARLEIKSIRNGDVQKGIPHRFLYNHPDEAQSIPVSFPLRYNEQSPHALL
jgi:hypothetical protein